MRVILLSLIIIVLTLGTVYAGQADVLQVEVKRTGENSFHFNVTVVHNDEGWDHYANKWDIVTPDGNVLATRVLHHPHENEQPFTRSLGNVKIPASISDVSIRAHDSVHGYGGKIVTVQLPR